MEEKIITKCANCGAEVKMSKDGCYECDNCHTGVAKLCTDKPKYATPCIFCGASIPVQYGDFGSKVCPDCKALWKKLQRKFSTQAGSTVVALTKEQDLLGFYGRVLDVRTGEALVEFPMVKGKRVVTWLKDEDYTEVE